MPYIPINITLDGSGAAAATKIPNSVQHGTITAISLSKDGMTANPTVTIRKQPLGAAVLNGVTVTADTIYHPRVNIAGNDGAAVAGEYDRHALTGGTLEITVTGGDASGSVSGLIEVVTQ